jgi:hypothetical protein
VQRKMAPRAVVAAPAFPRDDARHDPPSRENGERYGGICVAMSPVV